MVLFPSEFKISRSLRKTLRNSDYTVRLDTISRRSSAPAPRPPRGQHGTWITRRNAGRLLHAA
jgi:leucyl/phenylalanyl-tRNA--protein transferase